MTDTSASSDTGGAAPRYYALIPAAGVGARMASATPKQYLAVAGKPMLRHAVDAFAASALVSQTYVVVSADDAMIAGVLPEGTPGVTVLRCGGATRMDSVLNGLRALRTQLRDIDLVMVHDAARPGLTPALIASLVEGVGGDEAGGLLALPVVDTVKRAGAAVLGAGRTGTLADAAGRPSPGGGQAAGQTAGHAAGQGVATDCGAAAAVAVSTVPRDGLWLAQTPQLFSYALLVRALSSSAMAAGAGAITDDASAVEALGLAPRLIEGHPCNLKVTLPLDIRIAEMYLAAHQRQGTP